MERSQRMLDFERDLRLISIRLHALEDHFEDGGTIAQLVRELEQIAMDMERIKERAVGDSDIQH